ncbi:Minor extracellular protease vpr [Colletotrichum tanaceti]|uniref:Minor extracellular protease vpr n=1 Tax=Colletotrichum tanaceti TaxID=1306861 RepID=A0A4U6XMG5_9PEZI|nr:Minor extracellular protease vpr [Colletotrichum tanaceti]
MPPRTWETDAQTSASFYRDLGLDVQHRRDLNFRLFKGASFRVRNASRSDDDDTTTDMSRRIAEMPGVKGVWPVRTVRMPTPKPISVGRRSNTNNPERRASGTGGGAGKRQEDHPPGNNNTDSDSDTFTPHVMTQVDRLRAEGFTGKGIRIAVVDSGIDYTHPALGGCFGEGCLVGYGWDLTGDDYFPPQSPAPDPDPFEDCIGHGTHVAGTIAAQANEMGFTGAAPGVTLGAYRAWGCSGLSTNDVLLDAFNRAFEDGSDIISCSAGYHTGFANDPWGIAASRIVAQGVPVIVSPGNSGSDGMFMAASPATGVEVTAVGSVENTVTPLLLEAGSYTVGSNNNSHNSNSTAADVHPFGLVSGTPAFPANITLPLWAVSNNPASDNDACAALPDDTPDLSSRVVLLRVADTPPCYSVTQVDNLVAKGARYLLFYSRSNSSIESIYASADGLVAVGAVNAAQGTRWINLLNQGRSVAVSITASDAAGIRYEEVPNTVSGDLTSLSSPWGPTWEAVSKPQLTAPGGNILSTWPVSKGGYAVLSGTSMSTPLVAAVFALVGQARGTLDPVELRSVISSTAHPRAWYDGAAVHDIAAPVAQQGTGVVRAYDAAHSKTVLSISQISFNDTDHFVRSHSFSIRNTADHDLTYTLGHTRAATAYTFAAGSRFASQFPNPVVDDWAELSFSVSEIVVPAGSSAEITVSATPPQNVNATQLPVYSGYVDVAASNGESHKIPYLGIAGSLKDVPVFLEGPAFGTYLGYFNNPTPANTTFTIPRPGAPPPPDGAEFPSMLARLLFGSQIVRADVVPLTETGLPTTAHFDLRSIGHLPGFPEPWVSRRNYRPAFRGDLADGTIVPEGTYKVVFSALRAFGDPSKKEDWDFAATVPFVIKYLS